MDDYNAINNFIIACNEFIDGKYILADIKIGKILTAISQSDKLYNLLAESLINYDFDKELNKIQSMNKRDGYAFLTLPDDYNVVVPFVFSLLVEIDSKHLSFGDFLSASFPLSNSQKEEYEAFGKYIITPFRDAIAHIFMSDTPLTRPVADTLEVKAEEPEKDDTPPAKIEEHATNVSYEKEGDNSLLFDSIARVCGVIRDKLPLIKKELTRSNASLLVDALIEACYLRNFTILIALVMSLESDFSRERVIRDEVRGITEIVYQFYN